MGPDKHLRIINCFPPTMLYTLVHISFVVLMFIHQKYQLLNLLFSSKDLSSLYDGKYIYNNMFICIHYIIHTGKLHTIRVD